ncbi:MAG: hypothetical protein JNK34_05750 [Tabrizicola sp.]|nr:hypothetical protein [Tabrizicola sp.]
MRTIDTALNAHLIAREGIDAHVLVWIEAKNKITGVAEPFGIWTGDDDRTFTIDGGPRDYLGQGSLIDVGDIVAEAGYVVRITRMILAHLQPDIAAILATRDLRHVPVTWHQVHLAPGSFELVAPPRRVFKGRVEVTPLPDGAEGDEVAAEFELVSYARDMTLPLDLKKSSAALLAREPTDTFRQYIAVSGKISTMWGEGRAHMPTAPAAPGSSRPVNRRSGSDR